MQRDYFNLVRLSLSGFLLLPYVLLIQPIAYYYVSKEQAHTKLSPNELDMYVLPINVNSCFLKFQKRKLRQIF